MTILQKNWKITFAAALTTVALAVLPIVNIAHACGMAAGTGSC